MGLPTSVTNRNDPAKLAFLKAKCDDHFTKAARSDLYHRVLTPLGKYFNKSEGDIYKAFIHYNVDINCYTNEFYSTLDSRFALAINYLLPGTWFFRRVEAYAQSCRQHRVIYDIGFGVPLIFLYHALRSQTPSLDWDFYYLDKFDSALSFGEQFVRLIVKAYPSLFGGKITTQFGFWDLDDIGQHNRRPKRSDLVILADCIEHAKSPEASLRHLLGYFLANRYLISLSIGPIIPQHTIEFASESEVVRFLRAAGLEMVSSNLVKADWGIDLVGNEDFIGCLFAECKKG